MGFVSTDHGVAVQAHARLHDRWTPTTLFPSLDEASDFFRRDSAGYSATSDERCLDGLELETGTWQVEPVQILTASSTFFDDTRRFPSGSATLDCALLMRDIPVTWNPLPQLVTGVNDDSVLSRSAT